MDMTRERISFTFDPRDMLLFLQIGFKAALLFWFFGGFSWTLLIYRAFSEINRYNHPYQIISRTVKYQSFVINIINLLGALYLITINLFLILISKLVPLTLELARTLNMFIRLQVMLLRAI